ncbi:hypothetical protein [Candidatus Palauibacter sp.]|uniref:hypothetical protein n=1 Tax=Candidatus Palauibacter sp. TaxID=3101350 RepID=UPI003B52606C
MATDDDVRGIKESLERIVHIVENWSSKPEVRMATALERIADALEQNKSSR